MKTPRLYRIGKGPAFPIANLSKGHPLWGMPAGLFNATAPADRPKVAADYIDAQRALFAPRKAVAASDPTRHVKRRSLSSGLLAATLAAGMIGSAR